MPGWHSVQGVASRPLSHHYSESQQKGTKKPLQWGGEGSVSELKDGRQGRDQESSC